MSSHLVSAMCLAFLCTVTFQSLGVKSELPDDVPDALSNNCTWERKYDYRKPAPTRLLYEETFGGTEEECKQRCAERVVCNYANYKEKARRGSRYRKYRGKWCQLVPRMPFHYSFVTEDRTTPGIYIMHTKNCPVENFLKRADDPEVLVMCRLQRVNKLLDRTYAYQVAQYMPNIENRDEAEYWCRTDPLCKAISYYTQYNNDFWIFFYKVVEMDAPVGADVMTSVKDCQPTASECLFTSYKNKMVNGGRPYKKYEFPNRRTYKNIFECEQLCERNSTCYAAVAAEGSWRRNGRTCLLYNRQDVTGLVPLKIRARRYSRTFLKDHCL